MWIVKFFNDLGLLDIQRDQKGHQVIHSTAFQLINHLDYDLNSLTSISSSLPMPSPYAGSAL